MAGFEGYSYKYVYFYGNAQQLYKMGDFTLGNGTSQYSASGQQHKYNTAGFFFTANYNYDEKYFVNVGYRRWYLSICKRTIVGVTSTTAVWVGI